MEAIERIDITTLLPQQRPFVMIDRLTYFDETTVSSELVVTPDNIFVENGKFTEPGIIENMAQTAAARMGYINKHVQKGDVKLGFIGEIKNLSVQKLPVVDSSLKTTVVITKEVFSTLLVQAQVQVKEETVASCEMKIFITDISSQA